MGDTMRPLDLAVLLAILAAVVVILAASTPVRTSSPLPGPLSVDEATTFFVDTPVLVSGYLVRRGRRAYLCEAPGCRGVRLAVVGSPEHASRQRLLVAGVVTGFEIAPLHLGTSRRTARL